MSTMRRPVHPGEMIERRLDKLTPRPNTKQFAEELRVSPSWLRRVMKGHAPIKAYMAIRLARILGMSPETWMRRQVAYDLWEAAEAEGLRKSDLPGREPTPDVPLVILIMAGRSASRARGVRQ